MSETPEKPPSANNVTTIYLTPEYRAKLARSISKHGAESTSALVRVLLDADQPVETESPTE